MIRCGAESEELNAKVARGAKDANVCPSSPSRAVWFEFFSGVARQRVALAPKPPTEAEATATRERLRYGSPFGDEAWVKGRVIRLGLQSTLRPRARPRKET